AGPADGEHAVGQEFLLSGNGVVCRGAVGVLVIRSDTRRLAGRTNRDTAARNRTHHLPLRSQSTGRFCFPGRSQSSAWNPRGWGRGNGPAAVPPWPAQRAPL